MSEPARQYEPLFTPEEVAAVFKVSDDTIRQMIRKGELRAIKFGRQYRVPKSVVDAYFRFPDLDGIETLVVQAYQAGIISTGKLGELLGFTFYQTLDYLKAKHIEPRVGPETGADAAAEVASARDLFAR